MSPVDPARESEFARIVAHVKASQLLSERQARRFVERNLNRDTLNYWRAWGKFPVTRREARQILARGGRR